jgi:ribulose-5-phosphate 4-epimerase/fuculose-1-phosphate aldolase
MKIEDGYIKFNCIWNNAAFHLPDHLYNKLSFWRNRLFQHNLIGSYADGIGFGNISIRLADTRFIISGTATGGKSILEKNHYALVTEFNLAKNMVKCTGKIMASAESMSHAAIYARSAETGAIIHIHNMLLWEKLKDKLPTTKYEVEYGTPEMAFEIQDLFDRTDVSHTKLFVMGGHKEGIVAFGSNLDEAGEMISKYFDI